MKRTFVQCARLVPEADTDPAAPGGAVTLALCGSWDHTGACRWPHQTSAAWNEERGWVRVVFVADEKDENAVRILIARALESGACAGPDGKLSRWAVAEHDAGVLSESEKELGARIADPPVAE